MVHRLLAYGQRLQRSTFVRLSLLALSAPLWVMGCQEGAGSLMGLLSSGVEAPPLVKSVQYSYALDAAGAQPDPAGGWRVKLPSGQQILVRRGWATLYTAQLVPCPREGKAVAPAALGLLKLLAPAQAYAGHSKQLDPSGLNPPVVLSLKKPGLTPLALKTFPAQHYCQTHFLMARATQEAVGLPADVDMVRTSLHLEGVLEQADGKPLKPFTIHTPVAHGKLIDLPKDVISRAAQQDGKLEITLHQSLGTLFQNVDLENLPEQRLARAVLQNLIDQSTLDVREVSHE
jgi:hypothetical protein